LDLEAYVTKMAYTPMKKDPENSPSKHVNNYITPVEKKRIDVIESMR